jgi:hypothetical protein
MRNLPSFQSVGAGLALWFAESGALLAGEPARTAESWKDELSGFVAKREAETGRAAGAIDPRWFGPSITTIATCPADWLQKDSESFSEHQVSGYFQWILTRGYLVGVYRVPTVPDAVCGWLEQPERRALTPEELTLIDKAGRIGLEMTRENFERLRARESASSIDKD